MLRFFDEIGEQAGLSAVTFVPPILILWTSGVEEVGRIGIYIALATSMQSLLQASFFRPLQANNRGEELIGFPMSVVASACSAFGLLLSAAMGLLSSFTSESWPWLIAAIASRFSYDSMRAARHASEIKLKLGGLIPGIVMLVILGMGVILAYKREVVFNATNGLMLMALAFSISCILQRRGNSGNVEYFKVIKNSFEFLFGNRRLAVASGIWMVSGQITLWTIGYALGAVALGVVALCGRIAGAANFATQAVEPRTLSKLRGSDYDFRKMLKVYFEVLPYLVLPTIILLFVPGQIWSNYVGVPLDSVPLLMACMAVQILRQLNIGLDWMLIALNYQDKLLRNIIAQFVAVIVAAFALIVHPSLVVFALGQAVVQIVANIYAVRALRSSP